MSDLTVQNPKFVITLDLDPAANDHIREATGMESKWFKSSDLFGESDLAPVAVFLEARLAMEGPNNGALIPKLKDNWPLSPIILMSGPEDDEIVTELMALGADDFIGKPIDNTEISSRMNVRLGALAKRAAKETIKIGDLTIDTLQRSVTSHKGAKYLSPTEIKLISELARSVGNVVPRDVLKKRCWPNSKVSDNALNRKLYEVRRRLEPLSDQITIRTIYGVGFILEERRR